MCMKMNMPPTYVVLSPINTGTQSLWSQISSVLAGRFPFTDKHGYGTWSLY